MQLEVIYDPPDIAFEKSLAENDITIDMKSGGFEVIVGHLRYP